MGRYPYVLDRKDDSSRFASIGWQDSTSPTPQKSLYAFQTLSTSYLSTRIGTAA